MIHQETIEVPEMENFSEDNSTQIQGKWIDQWDGDRDPFDEPDFIQNPENYRLPEEEIPRIMHPVCAHDDDTLPLPLKGTAENKLEQYGTFAVMIGVIASICLGFIEKDGVVSGLVNVAKNAASTGASVATYVHSKKVHKHDSALSREIHERDKEFSMQSQKIDHRVAYALQRRDQLLSKKIHMIQMQINLAQNELAMAHDLLLAMNESIRDMYDATNQKLGTLILASTVMFDALCTVMIQGDLPSPTEAPNPTIIWFMAGAGTTSFGFLFASIVLCIELLDNISRRMQDASILQCRQLEEAHVSILGTFARKDVVRSSPQELQEEWVSHEECMDEKLMEMEKRRKAIKKLTSVKRLEAFRDELQRKTGRAELCFYVGTALMLGCTADFLYAQYAETYSAKEYYPDITGWGAVTSIVISIIGSIVYVLYERSQDQSPLTAGNDRSYSSKYKSRAEQTADSEKGESQQNDSKHSPHDGFCPIPSLREDPLLKVGTFAKIANMSSTDVSYLLARKLIPFEVIKACCEGGCDDCIRIRASTVKRLPKVLVEVESRVDSSAWIAHPNFSSARAVAGDEYAGAAASYNFHDVGDAQAAAPVVGNARERSVFPMHRSGGGQGGLSGHGSVRPVGGGQLSASAGAEIRKAGAREGKLRVTAGTAGGLKGVKVGSRTQLSEIGDTTTGSEMDPVSASFEDMFGFRSPSKDFSVQPDFLSQQSPPLESDAEMESDHNGRETGMYPKSSPGVRVLLWKGRNCVAVDDWKALLAQRATLRIGRAELAEELGVREEDLNSFRECGLVEWEEVTGHIVAVKLPRLSRDRKKDSSSTVPSYPIIERIYSYFSSLNTYICSFGVKEGYALKLHLLQFFYTNTVDSSILRLDCQAHPQALVSVVRDIVRAAIARPDEVAAAQSAVDMGWDELISAVQAQQNGLYVVELNGELQLLKAGLDMVMSGGLLKPKELWESDIKIDPMGDHREDSELSSFERNPVRHTSHLSMLDVNTDGGALHSTASKKRDVPSAVRKALQVLTSSSDLHRDGVESEPPSSSTLSPLHSFSAHSSYDSSSGGGGLIQMTAIGSTASGFTSLVSHLLPSFKSGSGRGHEALLGPNAAFTFARGGGYQSIHTHDEDDCVYGAHNDADASDNARSISGSAHASSTASSSVAVKVTESYQNSPWKDVIDASAKGSDRDGERGMVGPSGSDQLVEVKHRGSASTHGTEDTAQTSENDDSQLSFWALPATRNTRRDDP